MLKDLEELWMRDNLIETLRDCANALGELLPRDHAYRKIVDQANRLLDRHGSSVGRATSHIEKVLTEYVALLEFADQEMQSKDNGLGNWAPLFFPVMTLSWLQVRTNRSYCPSWRTLTEERRVSYQTHGSAKRGEEQWPL